MDSDIQSFGLEVMITFILMLVILRIPEDGGDVILHAAISVGFTVLVLALFAGPICGASMNPARSIGPALVSGDMTKPLDIHNWRHVRELCWLFQ